MKLFKRRRTRADGWAVAPMQPGAVAIEITPEELREVERLLRSAWSGLMSSPVKPRGEDPVPAMMRAWHMRIGAAAAAAHRDGVEPSGRLAFFESEIATVENAVRYLAGHPVVRNQIGQAGS